MNGLSSLNAIVIGSIVIAIVLIVGVLLAGLVRLFSREVVSGQQIMDAEKANVNPGVTYGYKIPLNADPEVQLQEARKLAARQAALTPRGTNMGIGKVGSDKLPTSYAGIGRDPLTMVKIAQVHGWDALHTSAREAEAPVATAAKAAAEAVPATKEPDDLVPGKDYPYIEITDNMEPAEVRKARIANAKARSAAIKALKEAGGPTEAPVKTAKTTIKTEEPAQAPVAPTAGLTREPVAGVDYEEIEISDAMAPDEIRKARIANAKARSTAMKRFKEAGGAEATVATTPETPASPAEPEPVAATTAIPAGIPQPNYIEISDGMSPDDLRKARIHNSKERSAYNKALKAAGIDPKTIE